MSKDVIEQKNLEVFSISKGETSTSLRLTRKHNISRNDPFFAIELFENLIEFHSIAVPKSTCTYELAKDEKLITFADNYDERDTTETRDFLLVVESEGKLWLRKVGICHEKILGDEEVQVEDVLSFDKPEVTIDHAAYVSD